MERRRPNDVSGWLLVYLAGAIPIFLVQAVGLSGWFLEYPVALMVLFFVLLATPLALLVRRSPRAPKWNIAALWTGAVLITLRSLHVLLWPVGGEGQPPMSPEEMRTVIAMLALIAGLSLGWAAVWTGYFRKSARVRDTFGSASG